jgi:DNA (cytosine-5)-methyltransferase 1
MAQIGLSQQVKARQAWPTPCTRDYKGANAEEGLTRNDGKSRMDQLPNAVAHGNKPETVGKLNPDWVEWLMGWPIGWTSIEPITELDWRDWSVDPADSDEVPRVAAGIKHRVGRLKAIGNGQVPQVAAMAWTILTQRD